MSTKMILIQYCINIMKNENEKRKTIGFENNCFTFNFHFFYSIKVFGFHLACACYRDKCSEYF